jgi:hypothetical protein
MKSFLIGFVAFAAFAGNADAGCVAGVRGAGCVGPNGGVVTTNRPVVTAETPAGVHCAKGVYRAGCVGPNGGVATRNGVATRGPGGCYYRNGVRVC